MIGPIGWEEFDDRQTTDDRQTDKSNPSVPYDTFACFAGSIKIKCPNVTIFTVSTEENKVHIIKSNMGNPNACMYSLNQVRPIENRHCVDAEHATDAQ